MNLATKIICRTIGTAGIGVALYDAVRVADSTARKKSIQVQEKHLEDVYYSSRTIDDVSNFQNDVREKTFDIRTRNPLPSFFGKIQGGVTGFIKTLGVNLPIIVTSALAIASKGIGAKIGALGTTAIFGYSILRQGFGFGKKNPMQ